MCANGNCQQGNLVQAIPKRMQDIVDNQDCPVLEKKKNKAPRMENAYLAHLQEKSSTSYKVEWIFFLLLKFLGNL